MLAICGGFQLLGQYYIEAGGRKIDGLGIMGHYTSTRPTTATSVTSKFTMMNLTKPTMVLKTTKAVPS